MSLKVNDATTVSEYINSGKPVNHYANGIPFTISGQIAVNKVSGALLCSGVLSCSAILSCEG